MLTMSTKGTAALKKRDHDTWATMIAMMIVDDAEEESTNGSWSVTLDELRPWSVETEDDIDAVCLAMLDLDDDVAEVTNYGDAISFVLWLDGCRNFGRESDED